MDRGVVLIGVKKTGSLPELQAVDSSIDNMCAWADSQNITGDRLKVLSDKNGEVRAHHISDAISELIALGTLQQLIVYFSGHGIHNKGDYWLLSRAPASPTEAVNVEGSRYLALYCGVPHVVIITDACRTAPSGIQAQGVTGQEVFPNDPPMDGRMGAVDLFYACGRGRPSLEIVDPNEAKKRYTAIYTDVLVSCLNGQVPTVLDQVVQNGVTAGLAIAGRTGDFLAQEVPKQLRVKLGPSFTENLVPDAAILSKGAWISRLSPFPPNATNSNSTHVAAESQDASPPVLYSRSVERSEVSGTLRERIVELFRLNPKADDDERSERASRQDPKPRNSRSTLKNEGSDQRVWNVVDASGTLLKLALKQPVSQEERQMLDSSDAAKQLLRSVDMLKAPFGPVELHERSGFKIRGKGVSGARCADGANTSIRRSVRRRQTVVDVDAKLDAVSVLLDFDDGTAALIPALKNQICALTFVDGELVDVAYEPLMSSHMWGPYQERADELRFLRAVIAASYQAGAFRIGQSMSEELLQAIYFFRTIDPSLGIYTTYALHDMGLHDQIRRISSLLDGWIGFSFFDIHMLSTARSVQRIQEGGRVLPFFPMLSRGWSLLRATQVFCSDDLFTVQRYVTDSPWTLFDADGAKQLEVAFNK